MNRINLSKYRLILVLIVGIVTTSCNEIPFDVKIEDRVIEIFPDYDSITIPSNIAPLNFYIKEEAERYYVKIS